MAGVRWAAARSAFRDTSSDLTGGWSSLRSPHACRGAGLFRRTPAERADQQLSWDRPDQAFFAAGACHVLAWTCRDVHASWGIETIALRFVGAPHAFHAVATWEDWSFDHCGWHRMSELLTANEEFERRAIECVHVTGDIADFCEQHRSRMPGQFWADPVPRAHEYVEQFVPPWMQL